MLRSNPNKMPHFSLWSLFTIPASVPRRTGLQTCPRRRRVSKLRRLPSRAGAAMLHVCCRHKSIPRSKEKLRMLATAVVERNAYECFPSASRSAAGSCSTAQRGPAKAGVTCNPKGSRPKQLELTGQLDFLKYPYHRGIVNYELPLSVGGGIGQSRTLMLLLRKAHLGEVSVTFGLKYSKRCARSGTSTSWSIRCSAPRV